MPSSTPLPVLQVCEEQGCEEGVFSLAVNLLDRLLACTQVRKGSLQLVATACLFIASKLRESSPLDAHRLVMYTDYSITTQQLLVSQSLISVYSITALQLLVSQSLISVYSITTLQLVIRFYFSTETTWNGLTTDQSDHSGEICKGGHACTDISDLVLQNVLGLKSLS